MGKVSGEIKGDSRGEFLVTTLKMVLGCERVLDRNVQGTVLQLVEIYVGGEEVPCDAWHGHRERGDV